MLLSQQSMLACINDGVIKDGKIEIAGPVSYDLTTQNFFADKVSYSQKLTSCILNPGDSVFVASIEVVNLPSNPACSVRIKNSCLRLELHLDALLVPSTASRRTLAS